MFSVEVIQDKTAKIQQILWIKRDDRAATIQQIQRIMRGEETQNSTTTDNQVRCESKNPTRTVSHNDIRSRNIGQVRRSDIAIQYATWISYDKWGWANSPRTLPKFKTIYYFRVNPPMPRVNIGIFCILITECPSCVLCASKKKWPLFPYTILAWFPITEIVSAHLCGTNCRKSWLNSVF